MNDSKKEAARKKSLGELGELFAIKALVDQKYTSIRNLNDFVHNFPFADLLAFNGEQYQAISVKARNKKQANGKINTHYNIGSKAYEHAKLVENEYSAVACWMIVQFDELTYSIYFGTLDELNGKNSIPVKKCESNDIGKCLVKDKRHYMDLSYFKNTSAE